MASQFFRLFSAMDSQKAYPEQRSKRQWNRRSFGKKQQNLFWSFGSHYEKFLIEPADWIIHEVLEKARIMALPGF
jgi:hypothetical protein